MGGTTIKTPQQILQLTFHTPAGVKNLSEVRPLVGPGPQPLPPETRLLIGCQMTNAAGSFISAVSV